MIVPKTNVEQTKNNEVLPLFIPFWGLISKKNLWKLSYVRHPRNFFEILLKIKMNKK
jgi:hypothetical protein